MPTNKGYMTTDGIDWNEILYDTILPLLDIYNDEEILDLRALVCHDANESYTQFDASGRYKFQKLAEGEKPFARKIVKGKRQKDTVKYGLGLGYTYDWLASEMASSREIKLMAKKAVSRDRSLQTAVILERMIQSSTDGFYNASFSAQENMTTPPTFGANTFAATHTHYVGAGSSTLALSYITAAKKHLKEHGFKGTIWGFANADFVQKIEDLAPWSVISGASSSPTAVRIVDNIAIDGFRGRMLGIDWKETEWMPDDYFLLVVAEGLEEKPVRFIQKKNPSFKGLILTPGSFDPNFPLIDASYLHWLEAQVLNRGAGVIYKLNASWGNPTSILTNVVE